MYGVDMYDDGSTCSNEKYSTLRGESCRMSSSSAVVNS